MNLPNVAVRGPIETKYYPLPTELPAFKVQSIGSSPDFYESSSDQKIPKVDSLRNITDLNCRYNCLFVFISCGRVTTEP